MNTLQVARDGSKSKSKRSKECSPYLGGPNAGVFTCNNGWEIYLPWKNNGRCECPDCEDETNWTCQTCGGSSMDMVTCGYQSPPGSRLELLSVSDGDIII
eukprot:g672.t1